MNVQQLTKQAIAICQALSRHGLVVLSTSLVLLIVVCTSLTRCDRDTAEAVVIEPSRPQAPALPPLDQALRQEPARFPRDSYLPKQREGNTSGSIDLESFSPGRDLCYVEDTRVWWESDNDKGDTECDHSMHRSIERPLRRLIELVHAEGGVLKLQDAYRGHGVHSPRSLHREGRALDLTCDELGLERLSKLCWAAGFDWVYYEASGRGGAHVHVSVRRDRDERQLTQAAK
jgi:hypothetical protein